MSESKRDRPRTLGWSDLHLGHKNIIEYEKRPFKSVDLMDRVLLKTWRETVKSSDVLWNFGDVTLGHSRTWLEETLKNLPGKKILILGNHDRSHSMKWWREIGFDEVYDRPVIVNGFFIFSHEPVYVGPGMPYVNFHGHTHSESSTNPQKVNLSVECIEYKPTDLDLLMAQFSDKRPEEDEVL